MIVLPRFFAQLLMCFNRTEDTARKYHIHNTQTGLQNDGSRGRCPVSLLINSPAGP